MDPCAGLTDEQGVWRMLQGTWGLVWEWQTSLLRAVHWRNWPCARMSCSGPWKVIHWDIGEQRARLYSIGPSFSPPPMLWIIQEQRMGLFIFLFLFLAQYLIYNMHTRNAYEITSNFTSLSFIKMRMTLYSTRFVSLKFLCAVLYDFLFKKKV